MPRNTDMPAALIVRDTELDELEFRMHVLARAHQEGVKRRTLALLRKAADALRDLSVALSEDPAATLGVGSVGLAALWHEAADAVKGDG